MKEDDRDLSLPDRSDIRPIRLLLVAATLPIVGGQTVQASLLLDLLNREDSIAVDIQSINPRFLPSLQKVKYLRTLVTSARYIYDLFRRIPKFDVIQIFSASYSSFVISPTPALLVAKVFRKKTILNYHSGEAEDHLQRWKYTAIPTIRRFDKIVVPSQYLVNVFKRFGFDATPVSNSIESAQFRGRERAPLRPIFLSNRNFEAHYNVACVLKAFSIIQSQHPDARLILVGDGSQRDLLCRVAAENALKNVEFRGSVKPDQMPQVYDEADIYLNASSIDNMPISILEAFASGLPVVSTNAGGIPYIVEDGRTGLLVSVDDHEGLAKGALRLLEDGDLASRIAGAAREEVERYSWENVKDQWLSVYRELADQGNSEKAR